MRAIVLAIIGVGSLWAGGQGLYTAGFNPDPATLSCAEYYESGTKAEWVRVSECLANWDQAVYSNSLTRAVDEIMVPIVPVNFDGTPKLVLITKEPHMRWRFSNLLRIYESGDDRRLGWFMDGPGSRLWEIQSFNGLIDFGFSEADDDDRENLQRLAPQLADDFKIIRHDEAPNFWMSLILTVVGLALVAPLRKLLRHGGSAHDDKNRGVSTR